MKDWGFEGNEWCSWWFTRGFWENALGSTIGWSSEQRWTVSLDWWNHGNKQINWLVKSFFQFNKAEEAKIRVVEQSKFTNYFCCCCCIDLIDPNDLCCCIELTPSAGWRCLCWFETLLLLRVQVLVQVGDVLDRGEDEIAILSLLAWLGKQARSNGGSVFQVQSFYHICCSVSGASDHISIAYTWTESLGSCLSAEHQQERIGIQEKNYLKGYRSQLELANIHKEMNYWCAIQFIKFWSFE